MALAAAAAQRKRQKALEAILQDCLTAPAERSKAQAGGCWAVMRPPLRAYQCFNVTSDPFLAAPTNQRLCWRQVDRLIAALSGEVRALRGLGASQLRSLVAAAKGCQLHVGEQQCPKPPAGRGQLKDRSLLTAHPVIHEPESCTLQESSQQSAWLLQLVIASF
jgi:hypothetical protein